MIIIIKILLIYQINYLQVRHCTKTCVREGVYSRSGPLEILAEVGPVQMSSIKYHPTHLSWFFMMGGRSPYLLNNTKPF